LCDGTRLEDVELRRNDELLLDSLGAERTSDPATAGDLQPHHGFQGAITPINRILNSG